jgi:hypothetical protein
MTKVTYVDCQHCQSKLKSAHTYRKHLRRYHPIAPGYYPGLAAAAPISSKQDCIPEQLRGPLVRMAAKDRSRAEELTIRLYRRYHARDVANMLGVSYRTVIHRTEMVNDSHRHAHKETMRAIRSKERTRWDGTALVELEDSPVEINF